MRRAALSKDAERSDTMVTKTYDWKLMVLIVERFIQWIISVVLVLVFSLLMSDVSIAFRLQIMIWFVITSFWFRFKIRDGSATGALLAHYCGSQVPDIIDSLSNKLWIKFRSDMSVSGRGFHAFYTSSKQNKQHFYINLKNDVYGIIKVIWECKGSVILFHYGLSLDLLTIIHYKDLNENM